eukprot:gnl/MRDRNA2_/MRDRNA2_192522_c0_seq1.p1 gnl/MRDRNA2_/MRDRNA2_192522_c0~~gnl/MRDRNA2_/MRDRNA2_192522_c0_seq1.p1  ORF type:complete len:366 (+),score=68.04 gnl/MRDRNA2_/MRDRNA2_192522_c0_seq1:70-1098(+)
MDAIATTSNVALEFWAGRLTPEQEIAMSEPCKKLDFFVSHSWVQPRDWYDYFRRRNQTTESFTYLKAADFNTIYIAKKKLMKTRNENQERQLCWIDRVCQPREGSIPGSAKTATVEVIEFAQQHCRGMVVLLSWNYFRELQCIFEWANFLARHPKLTDVDIGWDSSLRQSPQETLPLFLSAVESINVEQAECRRPEERIAFENRICNQFNGQERSDSFRKAEQFCQKFAIALMARSLILLRARAKDGHDWLGPVVKSAERMGFETIANIIGSASPQSWFNSKFQGDHGQYAAYIHRWFQDELVPVLNQERQTAVRPGIALRLSKVPDRKSGVSHLAVPSQTQ